MVSANRPVAAEWGNMRLGYVARARIPSDKANSIQVMKMSAAFASLVRSVELVVPYTGEGKRSGQAIWDRYAVKPSFRLTWLPYPHWGQRFEIRGYAIACWLYTQLRGFDLVYTRDPWVAYLLAGWGRHLKVGFEAHDLIEERRYPVWDPLFQGSRFSSRLRGVFCISGGLADAYRQAGASEELLHVAPDGVDLTLFSPAQSKGEARTSLGLPPAAAIVCHAGQLYPGRGIEETIEAVSGIPGALLLLVGGQTEDIARLRTWAETHRFESCVRFVGQVPNHQVPTYLWAADVLVMPYTSRTATVRFMSPLKMFEYMAAGRPIVATDFPAVREVLEDQRTAILVRPDGIGPLREGIQLVLTHEDQAIRIAEAARAEVRKYDWTQRARHILSLLA